MHKYSRLIILAVAITAVQCDIINDDHLANPNAPAPENIDPNFLLNSIQINVANLFQNLGNTGAELTRMYQMSGTTYENTYAPQTFDNEWSLAYATILVDTKALITSSKEQRLFTHAAISHILQAYTLALLTDNFGDVPFSEAFDPLNFNPSVDQGSEIYTQALKDLDSALVNFDKDQVALPATDLFYGRISDAANYKNAWRALAHTIEARLLLNSRSDDARLNTILTQSLSVDSVLIDTENEAFFFQYSTTAANPDSRHPEFIGNYLAGAGDYMSVYLMDGMLNDKSIPDPRIRYYFYRQVNSNTIDINEQQCLGNPPPSHYRADDPHCQITPNLGYWGRDHGNNLGIPPDNLLRTTFGVYPAGGRFDADQATGVTNADGLAGAGIQPIWMPFFSDFLRAEVELSINNNIAAARTALEDGIKNSINYVKNFAIPAVALEAGADTLFVPSDGTITAYVNEVLAAYDAASSTNDKLAVASKEYYLALFGNGVEAYNLYRRTTYPNDLQPHLSPTPGSFYRSYIYPSSFVERNSSVGQKTTNSIRVFWDNSPDVFDF